MFFTITGVSFLFFSIALSLLCYRIFRYWKEGKDMVSKLFFFSASSFLLFALLTITRLIFFDNQFLLRIFVYVSTFLQIISFSIFAYFIFYVKFPKISPWFGAVPVFILGLAATFLNKFADFKPYLDSTGAVNWGLSQPLYPSLFLRVFLLFVTFIPIIIIFLQQLKESTDPYIRKKLIVFIVFLTIGAIVAGLDFIIISIFKIGAIWRDIVFIVLSIVLIFAFFLTGNKNKNINVE